MVTRWTRRLGVFTALIPMAGLRLLVTVVFRMDAPETLSRSMPVAAARTVPPVKVNPAVSRTYMSLPQRPDVEQVVTVVPGQLLMFNPLSPPERVRLDKFAGELVRTMTSPHVPEVVQVAIVVPGEFVTLMPLAPPEIVTFESEVCGEPLTRMTSPQFVPTLRDESAAPVQFTISMAFWQEFLLILVAVSPVAVTDAEEFMEIPAAPQPSKVMFIRLRRGAETA